MKQNSKWLVLAVVLLVIISIAVVIRNKTGVVWQQVYCGGIHTVALKTDGTLWAWGANYWGQLGDGTVITKTSPTRIGVDTDWSAIAVGEEHTIALKADGSAQPPGGTLWCWGALWYGLDGTETVTKTIPTRIGADTDWSAIDAGGYHNIALKTNGTLWGWGEIYFGDGGAGRISTCMTRTNPTRIGADTDWKSIACGCNYAFAIKTDGTLWAWGANYDGQLGDGTTISKTIPTRIGIDTDWAKISVGGNSNIALKTDGTLWAWGQNYHGQLGNGQSGDWTPITAPTKIGTDTNWAKILAGGIALKTDGTLWGWGSNSWGQLGDGTTISKTIPTRIGTDINWVKISTGGGYNIGIKTDGTLWAWGRNYYGQLGLGDTTDRTTPTQVVEKIK